jgi:ABC-type transport system involved in cytochrome bd biosynthesis fused ATPase/permease subunit
MSVLRDRPLHRLVFATLAAPLVLGLAACSSEESATTGSEPVAAVAPPAVNSLKLRTSASWRGFKSFVEPAELRIEPGLTGVVGPNGCGKSNLLEAIRWVMGETCSKLRPSRCVRAGWKT